MKKLSVFLFALLFASVVSAQSVAPFIPNSANDKLFEQIARLEGFKSGKNVIVFDQHLHLLPDVGPKHFGTEVTAILNEPLTHGICYAGDLPKTMKCVFEKDIKSTLVKIVLDRGEVTLKFSYKGHTYALVGIAYLK